MIDEYKMLKRVKQGILLLKTELEQCTLSSRRCWKLRGEYVTCWMKKVPRTVPRNREDWSACLHKLLLSNW
jgi:hypothetical protein